MNVASREAKPLVYSCSGCSSAAQMANDLAIQLDRSGLAEMSCIAGVGGNVKKLVRLAKSRRKLITIDGCPLACSKACLRNHELIPDLHFELTSFGVAKTLRQDFDEVQSREILGQIEKVIKRRCAVSEPKSVTQGDTFNQDKDDDEVSARKI